MYKEVKAFDNSGLYFIMVMITSSGMVVMWIGKDYDQINGLASDNSNGRAIDKDVTDNFSELSKLFR